jgi:uncharacterized protein
MAYIAFIFLGGAVLAPALVKLTNWSASHFWALDSLATQPFHRYLNRSFLIVALLTLWPFLRAVGVRSWQDFGLGRPAHRWRSFGRGFTIGFFSLACVATVTLTFDGRGLNLAGGFAAISKRLVNSLFSAVVVGVLEESLFRGALFGSLRKILPWSSALLLSSVSFAALHFLQRPASPDRLSWAAGLVLLPGMLGGFAEPKMLVPSFFTLVLAGLILGLVYQKTGNLYCSIGMHAGWIFWQKTYGFLTRDAIGSNPLIWGSRKMVDGWLAFVVLLATFLFCWALHCRRNELRM